MEVNKEFWVGLLTVIGTEGRDWDYYLIFLPLWEMPVFAHQN